MFHFCLPLFHFLIKLYHNVFGLSSVFLKFFYFFREHLFQIFASACRIILLLIPFMVYGWVRWLWAHQKCKGEAFTASPSVPSHQQVLNQFKQVVPQVNVFGVVRFPDESIQAVEFFAVDFHQRIAFAIFEQINCFKDDRHFGGLIGGQGVVDVIDFFGGEFYEHFQVPHFLYLYIYYHRIRGIARLFFVLVSVFWGNNFITFFKMKFFCFKISN